MPDSKITALTSIGTSTDPVLDQMVIVDVSDGSMAATGTTKKVSLNQLLATSPTATLASATITGDLTVDTSTLKVDSANNRVGVRTATPAAPLHVASGNIRLDDGYQLEFGGSTNSVAGSNATNTVQIYTNNVERYRIDSTGISIWSVGGSEAMRLNSTGLGLGRTPGARLDTQGSTSDSSAYAFFARNSAGNAMMSARNDGRFVFGTGAVDNVFFEASGNVGVGVSTFGTSAAKVLGLANATAPTTSPAGMGQLYVEAGALKYRGSSGTITTLAVA